MKNFRDPTDNKRENGSNESRTADARPITHESTRGAERDALISESAIQKTDYSAR